jgi:hypothetical protein
LSPPWVFPPYRTVPMSRPRHPNKHIEAVVQYAESVGWRVSLSNGHAWGHILCPHTARDGCMLSVWSTPRSAENHARQLRREIDRCPHTAPPAPPAADEEATDDAESG